MNLHFYLRYGKRALDIAMALGTLPLTLPVAILVAILVRLRLGSPIIYRQVRPGLNGRPFEIWKFRTMTDRRGPDGSLLPDRDRMTALGRFLRSTSLDELPELGNILRGDMSLVGPRPLLVEYLDRYSPRQARRHEVRPGLTGWAQIHGRNAIRWEEKFELDVWYVDHVSFSLDLRILVRTVHETLRRTGINEPGEATAAPFLGTPRPDPQKSTERRA